MAMMQKDAKKLVAYSSVSHLGFCMLGLFALNPNGINGSIIQQINHGISTGALFLIVGIIYERRHTREIAEYGGLSHVMPDLCDDFSHHYHVIHWAAVAQWLHRRVHHSGRSLSAADQLGRRGGASGSCWVQPICFGCTSG